MTFQPEDDERSMVTAQQKLAHIRALMSKHCSGKELSVDAFLEERRAEAAREEEKLERYSDGLATP